MNLFKKKPYRFPNLPNKGGVDEWLLRVGKHKDELLELVERLPSKDCFNCWWLQFGETANNRVCKKPGNLNVKYTSPVSAKCLDWRVDPNARNRAKGLAGFIE